MIRIPLSVTFACAIALLAATGCNFSDPVTSLPTSGCADDGDCNDNGTCDVQGGQGVCMCDTGYEGNTCRDCADGYRSLSGECVEQSQTNNGSNNTTGNSNNQTTMECGEGEYLEGDECLIDGCAANPCGDGTCTQLGDNLWSCACPNGTNGIDCPLCAEGCENGDCNPDGVCECSPGWDGVACDTCAPGFAGVNCDTCASNAFGPNCDTCDTINAATAWWDTEYGARQGIIVYNPGDSTRIIQEGMVTSHEFDHASLVSAGSSSQRGDDVRIVQGGTELDRILGFDANWNARDTQVWFPTANDINPGQYDVYYMYTDNMQPGAVLNEVSNITRNDRSWFQANGEPIYRPRSITPADVGGAALALQVRQKDLTTVEVFYVDQSDTAGSSIVARFVNPSTGAQVASVTFDGTAGNSGTPGTVTEEVTLTNNALRLDVEINSASSSEIIQVYLGGNMVQSGAGTRTYQTTLSRSPHNSTIPQTFVCSPETQ